MTREEKSIAIENLTAQLADTNIIYVSDISGLNAETTSSLRRACYKAGIKLEVVKNTLLAKAMEASSNDYGDLPSVLSGNSAIFISDVANAPGKIIKDFRKKSAKPVLKGAYINSEIYIGDDQTDEDAFKVLKHRGISVKIINDGDETSEADYYLRSTEEVFDFLKSLKAIKTEGKKVNVYC